MARPKRTTNDPEELLLKWATYAPMSQSEVAACMGYTRPKVWQIEQNALRKIKAALDREISPTKEPA